MNWEHGRQGGGYEKLRLFQSRFPVPFDMYLIRYTPGSRVAPHVDPVGQGRHFRLNIILKAAREGGNFLCQKMIIDWPRVKLFRPDVYMHGVTKVMRGTRYVLSIGWILK